jgi:ABC-type amino acid transport substrate-binding protein
MEFPPEISIQFGQPVGYDHDIGVAVANQMGLRAEFVQTPFASIFGAPRERSATRSSTR